MEPSVTRSPEPEPILLTNILLPEGTLSSVHLGPGGVCAVISDSEDPVALLPALRTLLGSPRVFLYVDGVGRYHPYHQAVTELDAESISAELQEMLIQSPSCNSLDKVLLMRDLLLQADAHCRGYYTDTDGVRYISRNGQFVVVSDVDPAHQFYLTAFGGFLGLHRLTMGKYVTAALYLLTCGGFFVGWLLDLIQLLAGFARDKSGAVIPCPVALQRKIPLLILSITVGALAFVFYTLLLLRFLGATSAPSIPEYILEYIASMQGA